MAVDTFKLEQEQILAAKIETDTGVFEALSASEAGFLVYDPDLNGDFPTNDRPLTGSLGENVGVAGLPTGRITFGMDLMGKGATGVPLWASTFLPCCGMTESSGTYSFTGSAAAHPTLTIGLYEDGALRTLVGAAGTFEIRGTGGGVGRINFTFQGKYAEAADTGLLAPTFPTVLPPVVGGATLTLASHTPVVSEFVIDAGNSLVYRPDITRSGGLRAAAITGRSPRFTLDPEQTALSDRDWDAIRAASTTEAFSLQLGSAANNTIYITAAAAQVLQNPRNARNGIKGRLINGRFTGRDAFKIIFA